MENLKTARTITPMDIAKITGTEKLYEEMVLEDQSKKNLDIILDESKKNYGILNGEVL